MPILKSKQWRCKAVPQHSKELLMQHAHDDGTKDRGPSSGQVQAQAMRSVTLLNAIESTVLNLASNTTILRAMANDTRGLIAELEGRDLDQLIDPDGRTCELLEQAAEGAHRVYKKALAKREAARRDHLLRGEDGVEDAYTSYIAAIADFHNALEDARNMVADIDALKSPVAGGAFTDVDAMFAALEADAAKH
jgi:hypothetical protein